MAGSGSETTKSTFFNHPPKCMSDLRHQSASACLKKLDVHAREPAVRTVSILARLVSFASSSFCSGQCICRSLKAKRRGFVEFVREHQA